MLDLGIEQKPEDQCMALAKFYRGEAAAHWGAVANKIATLKGVFDDRT